jgi:hypothetical protein
MHNVNHSSAPPKTLARVIAHSIGPSDVRAHEAYPSYPPKGVAGLGFFDEFFSPQVQPEVAGTLDRLRSVGHLQLCVDVTDLPLYGLA